MLLQPESDKYISIRYLGTIFVFVTHLYEAVKSWYWSRVCWNELPEDVRFVALMLGTCLVFKTFFVSNRGFQKIFPRLKELNIHIKQNCFSLDNLFLSSLTMNVFVVYCQIDAHIWSLRKFCTLTSICWLQTVIHIDDIIWRNVSMIWSWSWKYICLQYLAKLKVNIKGFSIHWFLKMLFGYSLVKNFIFIFENNCHYRKFYSAGTNLTLKWSGQAKSTTCFWFNI